MYRNNADIISKISAILAKESDISKVKDFVGAMLTKSELETLSKRWRILEMLKEGRTQREIAKELKVSLCKVTRGSQIIKNKKSVINEYLDRSKEDGNK